MVAPQGPRRFGRSQLCTQASCGCIGGRKGVCCIDSPALRLRSGRSGLKTVHWTVFAGRCPAAPHPTTRARQWSHPKGPVASDAVSFAPKRRAAASGAEKRSAASTARPAQVCAGVRRCKRSTGPFPPRLRRGPRLTPRRLRRGQLCTQTACGCIEGRKGVCCIDSPARAGVRGRSTLETVHWTVSSPAAPGTASHPRLHRGCTKGVRRATALFTDLTPQQAPQPTLAFPASNPHPSCTGSDHRSNARRP